MRVEAYGNQVDGLKRAIYILGSGFLIRKATQDLNAKCFYIMEYNK